MTKKAQETKSTTRKATEEKMRIKLAVPGNEMLPEGAMPNQEAAKGAKAIKLANVSYPIKLAEIAGGAVVVEDEQETPISEYLARATEAYRVLQDAETNFDKAVARRREAQSAEWKAAPRVTEAYCELGDTFFALEKLVAGGQLKQALYEHWWKDELGVRPYKRSRAKDLAHYLKGNERKELGLNKALELVKTRKAEEMGRDPQAIQVVKGCHSISAWS